MRKISSFIIALCLTLFFAWLVYAVPPAVHAATDWLGRWATSERYLLRTNWELSAQVFPHFGHIEMVFLYTLAVLGLFVVIRPGYRLAGRLWARRPVWRIRRETLLRLTAITMVSMIVGLFLGYIDRGLGDPETGSELLLGNRLTPPSTWHQYTDADERGMSFLRPYSDDSDSGQHVNRQGFFSKLDYTRATVDSLHRAGRKVVFVIGDSFVEGYSDGPWCHTFCELMKKDMKDQYAIFSMGVFTTDPLDYRLRVEKFVPELHPDMVIICFCGNNDIMEFDRRPTPHVPVIWSMTSPVFFKSNLYNKVILTSPDSLYHYFKNNTASNRASNILVKWACRKSNLASLAYGVVFPWLPTMDGRGDTCEATYRNLLAAKLVCGHDSVPYNIAFIPDRKDLKRNVNEYKNTYGKAFKDLLPDVIFPDSFIESDFRSSDDIHFNDAGNRKFADFLETIITKRSDLNQIRDQP